MEENRNNDTNWSWDDATKSENSYSEYRYTNQTDTTNTNYTASGNATTTPAADSKAKRSGGSRVLAAVLAVALLVCACFGGYYVYQTQNSPDAIVADASESTEAEGATEETRTIPSNDTAGSSDATESVTNENPAADSEQTNTVKTTHSSDTSFVVTDVTEMVKDAMKTVVSIDNNYTASMQTFFGFYTKDATDTGTGVIIGKSETQLLIVTNNHVIEGAESLKVHFIDDTVAAAEIKGTNPSMDLAIISVDLTDLSNDTLGSISVATLGDSDQL